MEARPGVARARQSSGKLARQRVDENLERGPLAVRDMIIADLRRFMSLERGSIQPICCSCCGFFFPTIHVQDASKLEIVFGRTANHELADSDFEVAASSSEQ
jgi:hypothetical protein